MFYTMIPELRGTLLVGQRIIWQLLANRDKKKIIEPVRRENSKLTRPAMAIQRQGHYHKAENFTRIMSDVRIAGSAAGYPVAFPVVIKIPSQWPHINSQHAAFSLWSTPLARRALLLSLYRVYCRRLQVPPPIRASNRD